MLSSGGPSLFAARFWSATPSDPYRQVQTSFPFADAFDNEKHLGSWDFATAFDEVLQSHEAIQLTTISKPERLPVRGVVLVVLMN